MLYKLGQAQACQLFGIIKISSILPPPTAMSKAVSKSVSSTKNLQHSGNALTSALGNKSEPQRYLDLMGGTPKDDNWIAALTRKDLTKQLPQVERKAIGSATIAPPRKRPMVTT